MKRIMKYTKQGIQKRGLEVHENEQKGWKSINIIVSWLWTIMTVCANVWWKGVSQDSSLFVNLTNESLNKRLNTTPSTPDWKCLQSPLVFSLFGKLLTPNRNTAAALLLGASLVLPELEHPFVTREESFFFFWKGYGVGSWA